MRTFNDLHPYQVKAIKHIKHHPHAMLWLDMGLGKTTVVLHLLADLFDLVQSSGALVVAPLRVCQTVWRQEAREWTYTRSLTFSLVHGSVRERERALRKSAMVYLINYENLVWLEQELTAHWLSRGRSLPFDTLVLDEVSRVKNARIIQGSQQGRAVVRLSPHFDRRYGLTGTPASNGYLDLFGQFLCVDGGSRLGTSHEKYKRTYFYQSDWAGYSYLPFQHSESVIQDLIRDITLSMSNEDYLDLPELIQNDIWVDLPDKARKTYDELEKDFFLELDSGATIDIGSEASKINRCLQVANGAVYLRPGEPEFERIHDAKLKALDEVIEEAAGQPVLLAFQFQHDAHQIRKKYKHAKWISSKLKENEMLSLQSDWDEGKLQLVIGHPQSMGHGLNLQSGGNILVWYGLNWSQDLYSQTLARLRRQGQTKPVTVHRILARDTIDDVQRLALLEKGEREFSLRKAISAYRKK